ncbi:hypothetical protein RD792_016264 [Penstemon davidsonii]|uniref:Kinesin motor domain-containing protein n=1 Tax=Penstemon davidsonii TaxID=160366 RepID=A0ABR0CIZ0_9LAMI|nr:hypothetical protein RD792_016264 [Penstemon davidsonii]
MRATGGASRQAGLPACVPPGKQASGQWKANKKPAEERRRFVSSSEKNTISRFRGVGILFLTSSTRMLRDFKFLRRNSGKNPNTEEVENVPLNPRDLLNPQISIDHSRPPLNAIQDPSHVVISDQESSSIKVKNVNRTPSKPKPKYSDTSSTLRTPEKQGVISKGRFGWSQKNEYQSSNGVMDLKEEGRVVANMNTPRSTRGVGRANTSYSEPNSTQSTPTKSVSKPPNPGYCLASGSRPPLNGNTRMLALSKGFTSLPTVVNTVEVPYFELKEDPSFWMEHNVQVLIRVRPLNDMEKSSFGFSRCLKQESSQSITWIGQPETRFTFDHVACEAIDQETLFRMVGLPMVENCLSGYNSCMFAYGQTGSGKTYTMLGEIEELEVKPSLNRGMTPRIFEFLFARIRAEEESRRDERLAYNCKCSFLEIYNEQITDLLDPSSTNLMLREDMKKGVYVENLSEFEVHTVGDILQLLSQGSSNRRVASTNMNAESSRSHSVFTCVIESRWEKDSTTNFRFSRLNLVDLAGSERQKSSGAEGERLKEAANINRSLSTLGHVIMVLVDVANGKLKHVPYRDSRLTFLLQDSLGGNSKTMIIANVSPSICSAAETLNTLKFAQRAKLIQNNAIINEDSSGDVIALQHQLQLLKEELSALKREKVTRSLAFGPAMDRDIRNKDEDDCNEWKLKQDHPVDMLGKESNGVLRVSCEQLKSLETTLAGALRREQMAETSIKKLEEEIKQLNLLVSQREEDNRCTKMILKFREEKIQRMESLRGGLMSADEYLLKENTALSEEIQVLRASIDKNPEVTRFALENSRLLEQLRRFQDLYDEGEREMLMTEVFELRNQLVLSLDGNLKLPNHLNTKDSICRGNENDLIHEELKRTICELEETEAKLTSCLDDNAKLRRELEELHASLNSLTVATQGHNCSVEVIKEVEVPYSNNQSIVTTQRDKEARCGNIMNHTEEFMDLQLELDILKIILQEERSNRGETEEKAQSANREVQLSKEMVFSITKEYEALQEELKESKLVIEALESQQIRLINDLEDLRNSNSNYDELLRERELEMSSLKEQAHGQEFRDLSLYKHSESDISSLEGKLMKMHESLEKAKRLNQCYLSGLASQASNDEETEEIRKQVEAETAEVIVCLQEELSVLQQEVQDSKMKEMETRDSLALLQTEKKIWENNLHLRTEDNAKLAEMLESKVEELRILSKDWEVMTSEIEGILAGGEEALKDASKETELITTSISHKQSWISEQFGRMKNRIIEKELVTEELNQYLQDAIERKNDMECMMRSLRGAALAMAETHQQECSEKDKEIFLLKCDLSDRSSIVAELESLIKHGKSELRKATSCATAALVIVNRLHELNSNYQDALNVKDVENREFQEILTRKDIILHNQALVIEEARKQTHSLQMELEASEECCTKLRLQLSEEQRSLEDLRVKLEESKILETREKLEVLNSGVSTLKLCMNEYVKQSGDNQKDNAPEKSLVFSETDNCESWTGTRTERNINHVDKRNLEDVTVEISKCLSVAGTAKECTINENNLASESTLKSMKSRDSTIILLKKEIESALRSLQEVQTEMGKLRSEKEEILVSEKCSKKSIQFLMNQAVTLQDAIDCFEAQFELKVNALDGKLGKMEESVQESCTSWFQQRELLEAELDDAKVVAAQKTIEASCVFEKFEEVQDTMKEADIMINELLIANEALKLDARDLKVREKNLTSERDILVNEVQSLKLSNNLKDQQYDTDFVIMRKMLVELEDVVSQVQTTSIKECMSLASDFLGLKTQLHESTRLIRSLLEEVWSEIIVKDCAVSVLHLCHMGILLETANGLNAENGLLHRGLCESNSVISELREHNLKSRRELEICRVLEGKLLADIKKSFDRVSSKVDESGQLTLKLTSFEKKIQDLQFQEEVMLQRSNDMGSELALLMKDLDLSNKQTLSSIVDQEKLLKEKDEQFEYQAEYFLMQQSAKDFESLILSSELKQMSHLKADVEKTCISFVEVLENFKKDTILKSFDASFHELILFDMELDCTLLKKEVDMATRKEQGLFLALDERSSTIAQMGNVNKALEQEVQLLKEFVHLNESLKGSLEQVREEKKNLSCQIQNLESKFEQLEEDFRMRETALETKDEELGRMKCLEMENHELLQKLEDTKTEFESSLKGTRGLEVENYRLTDNISVLENCIAKLEKDLHQALVENENCQLSQSVVKNDLSLKIQDLEMQLDNINAVKEENIFLRNELKARNISESEYLNALSLKNLKNVDFVKNVDTICSKVLNLITERFNEIDNMFQTTVKEVEKTHGILEQFNNLENFAMQMDSEIIDIEMELSRKDDILKGLLFDLSLLQESTSNSKDQKDEVEEVMASFRGLEKDFELKSIELDQAVAEGQILKAQLQEKKAMISALELDISKKREIISSLSSKNSDLSASAKDALEAKSSMEKDLINSRKKYESLEMEVAEMETALAQMSETTESLQSKLDTVTSERDELDGKVLVLTKELDMARAFAEENEATANEAQEIAEFRKVQAEEKEEEIKLLERSIEELECTINVLEQKVGIVKDEAETQRLQREELELELHSAKEQMHNIKVNDSDIKRRLDEKEMNLQETSERVQLLEREIAARDGEISRCKAHINELNMHAEAQACEYKQKFKTLEAMLEQVKSEVPATQSTSTSSSHKLEKNSSKSRGSGSPFKCIGLGLVQQIKSENDEELSAGRQRIVELEALASSRQKEIFMLNARLAATESMTHDVIRDLLGVKLNMNSYATLMDNQQLHSLMEEVQQNNAETQVKDEEVVNLKLQIDEFIKERNGWLEEIERKQAELMAAHVALEKLRQQDQFHKTEYEMLKDENNLLRNQNEDLSIKLRKTEAILSRVKEELAQFRTANGRSPYINFDEEQKLDKMLKETEEERLQLAQKLLGLCTTVLKAAGIRRPTSEINISVAEEALDQLQNRVVSLEMELQDVKLKNRISDERSRLSELRPQTSTVVGASKAADEVSQVRNRLSQTPFLSALDR